MTEKAPRPGGPILAPDNASPAEASRPETLLEDRFNAYESNPAPWWVSLMWLAYLIGGAAYLINRMLE